MERELVRLDNFKRKLYIKYELRILLYKSILKSNQISNVYRYWSLYKKTKIIRVSFKSQHVNKCVETGRSRGVYKYTRYSRFKLRTESYHGNLPGFQKASW